MYKKLLVALLTVVMLVVFTGCSSTKIDMDAVKSSSLLGSKDAEIRWRFGTSTAPPPGHYVSGLVKFQELVEKYTDGKMTIDIYPQSQLGDETALIQLAGLGIMDGLVCATGPVPNFIPDVSILDFPYLFQNADEAYWALDGPIGKKLLKEFERIDIIGVGFWENGFRDTTNSKREIVHPSDLNNLKIRTMENRVHMATYNYLGATAVPMAYSELFTALQQKTLDGQENPPVIIATDKLYEAQSYISVTHVFYSPSCLLFSKESYDRLTPKMQKQVMRAAEEAKDWERQYSQKASEDGLKEMQDAGIKVTYVDVQEWADATAPIYDQADKLGANSKLLSQLRSDLEEYRKSEENK